MRPLVSQKWICESVDPRPFVLVDDSTIACMLHRISILDRIPHRVLPTKDGAGAVGAVARTMAGLILMDGAVIFRVTGYEACQVLRSWNATEKIPLILLTTQRLQESVKNGHESGCNDDLTKPVNAADLLALLESYIGTGYRGHKETQHRDD